MEVPVTKHYLRKNEIKEVPNFGFHTYSAFSVYPIKADNAGEGEHVRTPVFL